MLHYFAQEVNKENCTDLLKGAQVIGFSPKSFSESSTEIALVISNVLHKLANENQKKVIIFLDEFDRYSTTFWYEYPTILDWVISEFEDFELIKFVLTVESNTFYILEDDLKSSVVKSSVMMNITQEVLPEKIISTLNPRIEELKKVHGVKSICYEALEMIYTMSTVEIEMFFASYKRFLINLDNVLCWCELEGVNFLDCETVLNYYKENEKEIESEDSSEFFNNNYNKEDTALHETGHSVIALLNQDFIYLSGVSIFKIRTPSGDTGDGVTITNIDDRVWWMNRDNYVKYLAFYLAGKYAQKNLDSGNYDDLNVANYYAKKFVCSSGLSNPVGINVYYDADEYKNFSEHNKNIIDREVRELIKDATNYAKMAISNNKEFIAKMASALLKKNFLSRDEILKLWALYGNNQIE